jgi:hypothetical protein
MVRALPLLVLVLACASPEPIPHVENLEIGVTNQQRPSDPLARGTVVPCSMGTAFGVRYDLIGDGVTFVRAVWTHPQLPSPQVRTSAHRTVDSAWVVLVAGEPRTLTVLWRIAEPALQLVGAYELTLMAEGVTLVKANFVVQGCPLNGRAALRRDRDQFGESAPR